MQKNIKYHKSTLQKSLRSAKDNRPLSKFASGRKVIGAYGAEDRSVHVVHEDLSTGATPQFSAEVEFRKRSNSAYYIYGRHPVIAALSNLKRKCIRILLTSETKKWLNEYIITQRGRSPHERDARAFINNDLITDRIDRYSTLSTKQEITSRLKNCHIDICTHQGIIMQTIPLAQDGNALSAAMFFNNDMNKNKTIILILDHVQDPRNIGAMIRTAAAFGAQAIIVTKHDMPNECPAMVKAACGAFEIVPLINVGNLQRYILELKKHGFWILGLSHHAIDTTYNFKCHDYHKLAIILGGEESGMRRLTEEACDIVLKIPIINTESLNVTSACAIILYDICAKTLA